MLTADVSRRSPVIQNLPPALYVLMKSTEPCGSTNPGPGCPENRSRLMLLFNSRICGGSRMIRICNCPEQVVGRVLQL